MSRSRAFDTDSVEGLQALIRAAIRTNDMRLLREATVEVDDDVSMNAVEDKARDLIQFALNEQQRDVDDSLVEFMRDRVRTVERDHMLRAMKDLADEISDNLGDYEGNTWQAATDLLTDSQWVNRADLAEVVIRGLPSPDYSMSGSPWSYPHHALDTAREYIVNMVHERIQAEQDAIMDSYYAEGGRDE